MGELFDATIEQVAAILLQGVEQPLGHNYRCRSSHARSACRPRHGGAVGSLNKATLLPKTVAYCIFEQWREPAQTGTI